MYAGLEQTPATVAQLNERLTEPAQQTHLETVPFALCLL